MNTKNKIIAILMVSIVAMAVGVPMAMGESAVSQATVGNEAPDVVSVSVSPNPVTMSECGATTPITVTAQVSDANGCDDILKVEITATTVGGVTGLPISMSESSCVGTDATYVGTVDLPCCTAEGDYTVTVTVTDKGTTPLTDTGIGNFHVDALTAISVTTPVDFGAIAPGNSGTGTSTVKNIGNNPVEIAASPSDMTGPETILASAISDDWVDTTCRACGSNDVATFTLAVPTGTLTGDYTGTITFTPSNCP